MGEGYVNTQSSDFRKGIDSEGDVEINSAQTVYNVKH